MCGRMHARLTCVCSVFSLYFSISFHSLRLIHIEAFYHILLLRRRRRRLQMRNTISNFVIVGDAVAGVDVIVVILSHTDINDHHAVAVRSPERK